MWRLLAAAGGAACALALAGPVHAAGPAGYDGSNPFNCTLQNVGLGTDFPRPGDDPFCVEYDKTHQNVTMLGVVEFLAQEPVRVAAAVNKCFYYQHDHWTGSIVQGDGRTETYHWDGSYYFDKARGAGGVHLANFRVAGQTADPTLIPGFPAEYRPFFGPGRGGVQFTGAGIDVEQRCVELARRKRVYRAPRAGSSCRLAGGRIGRGIGGIRLGHRRSGVRSALGAPTSESRHALRYCLEGGGTLAVGFRSTGPRARAVIVKVDSPAFSTRGLGPGTGERRARRIMRGERVHRRGKGARLLLLRQRRRTLVASVRRGRVRYVAVARPGISLRALGRDLRRVR
jgi:hypothetical protein